MFWLINMLMSHSMNFYIREKKMNYIYFLNILDCDTFSSRNLYKNPLMMLFLSINEPILWIYKVSIIALFFISSVDLDLASHNWQKVNWKCVSHFYIFREILRSLILLILQPSIILWGKATHWWVSLVLIVLLEVQFNKVGDCNMK